MIWMDIGEAIKSASRADKKLCIRLNGTSNLPMLGIKFAKRFPEVQFYDYTKILGMTKYDLPRNYHLTFSRSEYNEKEILPLVKQGRNVAVLFDQIPETWNGFHVIDGDISDLRFVDPQGVIVGLSPKNKAKFDTTGFLVRLTDYKAAEPPLPKVSMLTVEKLTYYIANRFKVKQCADDIGRSVVSFYLHLNKVPELRAMWDQYQLAKTA